MAGERLSVLGHLPSVADHEMSEGTVPTHLVDVDVHVTLSDPKELVDYLPGPWRERWPNGEFYLGPNGGMAAPNGGTRIDARPSTGGPPASDPDLVERDLLCDASVDIAILRPTVIGDYEHPDVDAALKAAVNSWMADTWLSRYNTHGRYRGGIVVSTVNPSAGVAEIERWAGHPAMVEVQVGHVAVAGYGDQRYWPIWEAAAKHGLPIGMHPNTQGSPPLPGPVGHYQHYPEFHSIGFAHAVAAHLTSIVCSGIFEHLPNLHVACVEGGSGWAAGLVWRLDHIWRALRLDLPHVKRLPSEYVFERVRFATQPIEEPTRASDLIRLFELMDAKRLLMFSTDYPHWDFDSPRRALPRMPSVMESRIRYENAIEFYGLPTTVRPMPAARS
jgi:uncharacterized protein